ncbi:MAG: carbohydrate ABC transporter permease [Dermatophilaceae bacterium]
MMTTPAVGHWSVRRRRDLTRPGTTTYLVLLVTLLSAVFPFWWSYVVSSNGISAVNASPRPMLPGGYFFENASKVVDAIPFWKAMGNSIVVSTSISLSVVLFSTLAGYAFSKLAFRGRDVLLVFIIATTAVPSQLSVVPLFIAMSKFGWTGSLWAVILPNLVTAFGVFWMTQYLRGALPFELIEAARMDGCNMWRTFWHVGLPAARPAAAMLGVFTFITAWTNFFWPLIVLDPDNPTLPVALSQLEAGHFVDYSLVLTGVLLASLPLIGLFAVAGRQLIAGIMAGAVKS